MRKAFFVTAGAIVSWGAVSALSRVLLLRLDLDPWAFSFLQLCAGGVALMLIAGGKSPPLASLGRPTTWILGALRVLSAALYTTVLGWLSVLEAGTIGAVSVPLAALCVWLILGRRPARREWFGHLIILGGILTLFVHLDAPIQAPVAGLLGLNAVAIVTLSILAERHPDNLSDEPGVRLRFTGAVLLVTALFFLTLRILSPGAPDAAWPEPTWDLQLIAISAAVGIFLRAPSMVLSFWAIRLAGTQNYTAAIAFLPLTGMAFEEAAFAAGFLAVSRFEFATLAIALCVGSGTLLVLAARAGWRWPPGVPERRSAETQSGS
ncbi:MAG: EamA family transporter [Pseudomonadota bacterium]